MVEKEVKEDPASKKVKELLSQLKTKDEKKLLSALRSIKIHGNEEFIHPLASLLLKWDSVKVRDEVMELLNSLKDSKSIVPLFEIINDPIYIKFKSGFIAIFWNAPLNPINHIEEFVKLAVTGDYFVALESLTVIENLEGNFSEESLMDCQLLLKAYLDQTSKDDKLPFIIAIKEKIDELDNELAN